MSTPEKDVRISISPDRMQAAIIIPAGADGAAVSSEHLAALARERGLVVGPPVAAALGDAAEAFTETGDEVRRVFAKGAPPVRGEPAELRWADGFDPARRPDPADAADGADHYNAIDYIRVPEGEVIAEVVAPTEGTDGVNVLGEAVKAKRGRPLDVEFDRKSLDVSEEGSVRSKIAGVLIATARHVRVVDMLEFNDVDFTTGNIDATGSVHVRCAVKDRFEISATGDVMVDGLVEAAAITCGGCLILRRGMAARERGGVEIGGDMEAGFLDTVKGSVNGSVTIRREMMNCELSIGEELLGDAAAVVGGRTSVTGGVRIATLGSSAEVRTRLVLGGTPLLAQEAQELARRNVELERELERDAQELAALRAGSRLTAEQRERLTELTFGETTAKTALDENAARLQALEARMACERIVDLRVLRVIHPGAVIEVNGLEVTFSKALKGPVRLGCNELGKLLFRRAGGGAFHGIKEHAQVRKLAA